MVCPTTIWRRSIHGAARSEPQWYDAIVVGLGAHGSACLYHLAKWGSRVLGIERFGISHDQGSHHGLSRITRQAYFESPHYVPLLKKAYELYGTLERECKQRLFWQTGILNMGGRAFAGAHASAREHGLDHEVLTGKEASRRFPAFRLPDDMEVLWEPHGGILAPEAMIQAHCSVAQYHGATIRSDERVIGWRALDGAQPKLPSSAVRDGQSGAAASVGGDGGVEVTTTRGSYRADKLVLAGGAWMPHLVPELQGLVKAQRYVVAWFEARGDPAQVQPASMPVYILEDAATGIAFYGFPEFRHPGVKIGAFHSSGDTDPNAQQKDMTPGDERLLHGALQSYLPAAGGGRVLGFSACMFANTPDGHFVLDAHPRHPQVLLASACSGHGFKLSPVVGLALADMVRNGRCAQFERQLEIHRLAPERGPQFAAALQRFQRHV